jgi:lipoprotein-releasing system ATP-binding protein
MSSPAPLLELRGIRKRYHSGGDAPVQVLAGLDLQVEAGELLAIIGPSGSGKSTLLNIIGTLDSADEGSVRFDGRELGAQSEAERLAFRRRELGFVFQSHHLLPYLTVLENALVPTILTQVQGEEQRARELLERVGLGPRLHHRPGALSGGERQRAALVRALVGRPRLVLADEPTGSLDRAASEALTELLVELNRAEGTTLITVTHSVALAARAQRVLELRDGSLAPPREA